MESWNRNVQTAKTKEERAWGGSGCSVFLLSCGSTVRTVELDTESPLPVGIPLCILSLHGKGRSLRRPVLRASDHLAAAGSECC